jgi:hydrogenase maturation protease
VKVVVLGVGNVLMSDEGVGVRTVEALERAFDFPEDVRLVDGGTSTHELLGDLEDIDHLIIVDAVDAAVEPGSLMLVEGDAVPSAFTTKFSPHQVGISDLLATLRFLGRAPKHVELFGVQPSRIALDLEMSPLVAAVVPRLCGIVLDELQRLGVHAVPKGGVSLAA